MSIRAEQRIFGVVAGNSIGYLREVIDRLNSGDLVVTLRNEGDDERIDAIGVDEIIVPTEETGWLNSLDYPRSDAESTGQVLFTSGTEGEPKAILLSHAALSNTTDRLIAIQNVDATIREYLGVPTYYSFGFGRCRVAARVGGSLYVPPHGFDPGEIADLLSRGEVNAVSAVPTLWRLALEQADLFASCGHRVRWIEIGSQYMSRAEKENLKELFPKASVVQHYGLTEASRSTFLKIHEVEGDHLESVGKAYFGVEAEIDESGRIRLRGPHLASDMIRNGEKAPLVDSNGWLTTNDVGHIEDGYLYFESRADDLINCGGIKLSPELIERELYTALGLSSGICVAKTPDPLRGEAVLIAHLEEIDQNLVRVAADSILSGLGVNAGLSTKYLACESLPATETGKIQRKSITRLYESKQAAPDAESIVEAGRVHAGSMRDELAGLLGLLTIADGESFSSLGGDSLTYIQVSFVIERRLGTLPANWEKLPIGTLEAYESGEGAVFASAADDASRVYIDTDVLLRAIAITAVVYTHSMPAGLTPIQGAMATLLMAVGQNLARFRSDSLFRGEGLSLVRSTFTRYMLPYLGILVLYLIAKGKLDIPSLLFMSTFFGDRAGTFLQPFWFIEVFFQVTLILAGVFAVPPLRRAIAARPLGWGVGAVALLGALHVASNQMQKPLPALLLWSGIVALGWCVHFARSTPARVLLSLSAVTLPWLVPRGAAVGVVLVILIWLPRVRLFVGPLKEFVGRVGAASFQIYILHAVVLTLIGVVPGIRGSWIFPALGIPISLAAGIAFNALPSWRAWLTGKRSGDLSDRQDAI